ncbi:DUF86 domain-containing protein [Synechococcus sp. GFB01]|uniref:HepT-like ribonuclease domain-containing protein n=1 Tax=Synechococcus sp. GFB01 TaxID=1662190 RepID=UPI00191005CF|nr:HepT-like ribonuclease domain-containing protein [Synechococcus sp. GFB01]
MIEAGHAIQKAVDCISVDDYCKSRLIRSSVEREFTIIGEALSQLSRRDLDLFIQIDQAPQIISFRNKLTHDYVAINDQLVWGVIQGSLPALLAQCTQLLIELNGA